MKEILSPTSELEELLNNVFKNVYKININDGYKVIHLRFGDSYIHSNCFDKNLYDYYYNKINNLIHKNDDNYVLISDSSEMANKLKENIPKLLYWDNDKIHLGELINIEKSNILDTLVDFFIISKSKEILSSGTSGFSRINSVIYNIKHTIF